MDFLCSNRIYGCEFSAHALKKKKPKEETRKGLCEEEVSLMWWNQWTLFIAKMH